MSASANPSPQLAAICYCFLHYGRPGWTASVTGPSDTSERKIIHDLPVALALNGNCLADIAVLRDFSGLLRRFL
jgi:hypothetical protein